MDFPLTGIFFLLILSGFFSASETSLLSLSRQHLQYIREKYPKNYQTIRYLLDHPAGLIATLLLGNECASVLISNLLTSYYDQHIHSWVLITVINLCTALPMIVIFGEITPRIFAAKANINTANFVVPVIWFGYKISFPIRILLEKSVNFIVKILHLGYSDSTSLKEKDFLSLIEDSKNIGAIAEAEQDLIENVFSLDDVKAIDIAIPINQLFCVKPDDPIEEVIKKLHKDSATRIPVLGKEQNEVVGILYTKDLIHHMYLHDDEVKVLQFMKDPVFVEPNITLESLFKRLKQRRVHIAVVSTDEKIADGIVTMETLLDKIFGDLWEKT